jgi:hypothetical protein
VNVGSALPPPFRWALDAVGEFSAGLDEFSLHATANASTAMGINRVGRIRLSSGG